MADQALTVRRASSPLITSQKPTQPSGSSPLNSNLKAKSETLIENLSTLALAIGEPLSAERMVMYVRAMSDLSEQEIEYGFDRALKESRFWPRPAELREMCTGRAASMTDRLRIDSAWAWVQWYIKMFGVPAFGYPAKDRWEIQGQMFNGRDPERAIKGCAMPVTLAITAPFYEILVTVVPEIPELVSRTLVAMSGSVEMGLTRLNEDTKVRTGLDGFSTKDSAFVRKDFEEYCGRCIAATRIPTASQINPALQLTGNVASEFPMPMAKAIAVRIEHSGRAYKVRPLSFEELTQLNEVGSLPSHLYEEGIERHNRSEENTRLMCIPTEFNAVYRDIYFPLPPRRCVEPWPVMGRFTIESGDGARVVRESLIMAAPQKQPRLGQVFRFTSMPKDLRFDETKHFYFDLNTMRLHEGVQHEGN